jgi:hypothetical protein
MRNGMNLPRTRLCLLPLLILISAAPVASPTMADKTMALQEQWKDRLAEEKLRAIAAPPFVIAGNGSADQLAAYRDGTILAAMHSLEATYFDTPPTEPIIIFLFESEGPYKRLARKWFDDKDVPHYGFYRPGDRVMFMNVGTGTGTLVHELTHALIAPDFPDVPSWFNEGLASLYEQCSLGKDTITGHENWRLPALQKAIKAGTLRPLSELIEDPHFYREDLVGLNYAEARYLMFYLQEKGLLVRYYKEFRAAAKDDPTGLKTLQKIVAPKDKDLDAFEKEWRKWVLTLRFG